MFFSLHNPVRKKNEFGKSWHSRRLRRKSRTFIIFTNISIHICSTQKRIQTCPNPQNESIWCRLTAKHVKLLKGAKIVFIYKKKNISCPIQWKFIKKKQKQGYYLKSLEITPTISRSCNKIIRLTGVYSFRTTYLTK